MKTTNRPLQYACFGCRKCFKRPQFVTSSNRFMTQEQIDGQRHELEEFESERSYKCPDCGKLARYMGLDFKAPKKTDATGWQKVQVFVESGKLFHRGVRSDV